MKLSKLSFSVVLGLFAYSIFPGCSPEEKIIVGPLDPAGIKGVISLPPGDSGDISNTRVAVYDNFVDLRAGRALAETALTDRAQSDFVLELDSGGYFLELWKDLDGNGERNSGTDLWGFYGYGDTFTTDSTEITAIQVLTGRMTAIDLLVTIP
ncbi:MAG: hypothetical protein O6943_09985 [Bacteroidetes bacterium]|nr:hypothetical protein [Bacteroidota bacterium]